MKILVIGESCTDVFNYGRCNRLCPEAPVPIFNSIRTVENPGMAMNVQRNIRSLDVQVNIHTNSSWQNITKTRFIDLRTNHMFMRLDQGEDLYGRSKLKLIKFSKYDSVVISDYNKGFLSEEDIEYITSKHDVVFLDTKKRLGAWCEKAKFIKINEDEYARTKDSLSEKISKKLIVTLGPKGCRYNEVTYPVSEVEVKDTSGAGDTFVAALSVKYTETEDIEKSIEYANQCASVVVQKRGVGTT